jgi:hypothetical protein
MIDSRDFLAAKRRAETEVLLPAGPKIAFSGGDDFNDHRLIWAKLDQVHAKHPDMVLMHGGSPKGAERSPPRWADNRKVPQVAFKPDWTKHAKAAPFKRNDQMLDVLPIGVIVFPGTGIQDNLADKARKLGIPVYRFAPRRHWSALRRAGDRRRLSAVVCAGRHRHVHRRVADGIRRCRRHSLRRHGILTHDAFCPGVGRTGHRGSSLADWLEAARPETLTPSPSSSSNRLAKGGA